MCRQKLGGGVRGLAAFATETQFIGTLVSRLFLPAASDGKRLVPQDATNASGLGISASATFSTVGVPIKVRRVRQQVVIMENE